MKLSRFPLFSSPATPASTPLSRHCQCVSIVTLSSLMASLGGLLFGFDLGVAGGLLPELEKEFNLSVLQKTVFVSSFPSAAAVASIFCRLIVDSIGRRRAILATSVSSVTASLVLASAASLGMLVLGRSLMGASVAISIAADTMFVAEISPVSCRGRLVCINELAVCLGILLALFVDWVIPQGQWRLMMMLPIFIVVVQASILLYLPGSPRWLLMMNRVPEAVDSLQRLRQGQDKNAIWRELIAIDLARPRSDRVLDHFRPEHSHSEDVDVDDGPLLDTARDDSDSSSLSSAPGAADARSGTYRLALVIACSVVVLQNFSGQGVLFYYAPVVFREAGMSVDSALASGVLMGVIKLLSTSIALLAIDHFGRRPLLKVGVCFILIAQLMLAIALGNREVEFFQYVAVCGTLVFVTGYSLSFGPNSWLFQSEIFSDQMRAKAAGISSVFNWTSMMLVTLTFLPLSDAIGDSSMFLVFAGFSVVALAFIVYIVPETKQKTFEEIEADLTALRGRLC